MTIAVSSDFEKPDFRKWEPGKKRCDGRRLHPLNHEYFIQCELEIGHDGWHRQRQRLWDDKNPYAIIDDQCEKMDEAGVSIWRIKRAG